tara:strand:+ start:103 stop:453 length:351 start_codon:yes stop_codon:yes gene_type:complete
MLPIIHEYTQVNYTEKDYLKTMLTDYDILKGTITHFINAYYKMMRKTDDKDKFIKSNISLVVRSIDKCIYKFIQKYDDCRVYLKKVNDMNKIMLSTINDKTKFKMMIKLLKLNIKP